MKKWFMENNIIICIVIAITLIILDYINLPSLSGVKMLNMNWDFCIGMLNIVIIIMVYVITYNTLDKRTVEREKNKREISNLLLKECYQECIKTVEFLDKKVVEEYIVPKMDFNSTDNKMICNLQHIPFENENIIMDLVKDGQVAKQRIEKYFEIKRIFHQYITMRVACFDCADIYEPIRSQLFHEIDMEIKNFMEK